MALPKVGTVVITCPACGSAFEVGVYLSNTEFRYGGLVSHFVGDSVPHECKGRN